MSARFLVRVGPGDPWPEAVSDGLTLPCGRCSRVPEFDFNVDDDTWRRVVLPSLQRGVVCLPCFDVLATAAGIDIADSIERVQWCGVGHTVELLPQRITYYQAKANRLGRGDGAR